MKPLKILLLLTSHAQLGSTGRPTGFWLEELATPWSVFTDARAELTLASPLGGPAPVDPRSTKDDSPEVKRFLADRQAQAQLANTRRLGDLDPASFDVVFVVGGHGVMWDLATAEVGAQLGRAWAAGRVLAAVCHGPAALVEVKDGTGTPIVANRRVTGFSDAEERAAELERVVPFLLEARLTALGGRYEKAALWQPFTVRDGKLVTGQNPASARGTAQAALEAAR